LRGDRSEYISVEDENSILSHFPKAKIITISNAGHWLHAEKPKDFFEAVMNFVL
jgi:esterase